MRKAVERFIVIGDELSKDRSFHEVPLFDDNLSSFSNILKNDLNLWHTNLLDIIFYTSNNLPSGITNTASTIKYRDNINLQHYIDVYDASSISNHSSSGKDSRSQKNKNNLTNIADTITLPYLDQNTMNKCLVILFVGYNDIVDSNLSINHLIQKYQEKITFLILKGYTKFAILTLPNVDEKLADNISIFNSHLNIIMNSLKKRFINAQIDVLNTESVLSSVDNFLKQDTDTSNRFLSKEAHIAIADNFFTNIFKNTYEFLLPESILLELFRTGYSAKIAQNKSSRFAWCYTKPWSMYETATLDEIFMHADPKAKNRTFKVLHALDWVDRHGECISNNHLLINASTTKNNKVIG